VTAYQSPNTGHAIALLANAGATVVAVVDLTDMLNPTLVPRTEGPGLGHLCLPDPDTLQRILPPSVVRFITLPN
jgi:hypothetical protein